jgi:hypothetical protein
MINETTLIYHIYVERLTFCVLCSLQYQPLKKQKCKG